MNNLQKTINRHCQKEKKLNFAKVKTCINDVLMMNIRKSFLIKIN